MSPTGAITLSTIRAIQDRRIRQGIEPATAEEITEKLIVCPSPRHYRQVRRLLNTQRRP